MPLLDCSQGDLRRRVVHLDLGGDCLHVRARHTSIGVEAVTGAEAVMTG